MSRDSNPRVYLPDNVQTKEKRACKILLEKVAGAESVGGIVYGVEGDVELGRQADEIHHGADVGTPDSEGCFEGYFIGAVALQFPVKHS